MKKKFQKIFFDFKIIAFELVALNTHFYWERILFISCQYVNKQSLLKMNFLSWFFFRVIKKYDKDPAVQIQKAFPPL